MHQKRLSSDYLKSEDNPRIKSSFVCTNQQWIIFGLNLRSFILYNRRLTNSGFIDVRAFGLNDETACGKSV